MDLNEIVRKAQAGNEEAFCEIYRRFEGLVKRQAFQPHLRVLGEDASAEAWLAVAQAVQSYDEKTGVHFAGYVESKIKFALWNLFKRERRRWQHEFPATEGEDDENPGCFRLDTAADTVNIEQELEKAELSGELKKAIAKLSIRQRQALGMTMFDDCRLAETALQMGVTAQAVHNLRRRALTRLKKELTGMYVSERG